MTKNKKVLLISSISLAVIIVLGIVYAAFTQQLNINGSATGRSSKWDIHFENLSNVSLNGTAKELTSPTIRNNSTTIGDYSVSLTSPGDYVEYTFDVVNEGDYDATLTGLQKTALSCTGTGENASTDASNVCGKLTYTLTYADGQAVSQSDTLKSKETKTMKLKLLYQEFNDDSLLPKMDVTISGLGITLTYTQDGNAKVNANGTTPYVAPQSSYAVGDQITVANETYHIISVPAGEDYVVALKDEILEEYVQGPGIWIPLSSQFGSTSDYAASNVKKIVDSWANETFINGELKEISGYTVRLITLNELLSSFDYEISELETGYNIRPGSTIPNWLYSSTYWTMSPKGDSSSYVWYVDHNGLLFYNYVGNDGGAVRPVINVYKSKISS